MPQLALSCFGAFQAALDSERLTSFHSVKVQALLAYLALEADRPHHRETLAALLWPLDAEASARNSLRQALYELRKLLGDNDRSPTPFLLVTRQTVQFNAASDYTLDVADFLAALTNDQLSHAAALYQGDLLVGLSCDSEPFEEWLRLTRARLHNLAIDALYQLTQRSLEQGQYKQAQQHAQRQLALEPWREEAHRQLMTANAASGERSAALSQYETCRRVLAEELGVEPAAETTTLYEAIKAGKVRGKAVSSSEGEEVRARLAPSSLLRNNLPLQPTPFVGRKVELAQMATRLSDPACRLLTIVGPGGMGKTRLAIQAAQTIVDFGWVIDDAAATPRGNPQSPIRNPQFRGGVFFVALAGVSSPDLLVATIAAALDFTFYGSADPKTQLLDYLKPRTLLLVLDNCEHLLDGIDLVSDLLAAAPAVKVLATSREPLNLREEWLYPLSGMSFPGDGAEARALATDGLTQYTAVQLFVQCARQMRPGFDLAGEEAGVVRICRLVEGIPLAIELAATWLKFYSCVQIAEEITRDLDFLATSWRNVPARHRSMRAMFEHSWGLLSVGEQRVLQQLAVFRGGFTQAAAEQVAGASRPMLLALVEKSLVQRTPARRFQFHELLRQFAEEKLRSDPAELELVQDQHAAYYTALLARQESRLTGAEHMAAREEIESEIENVRTAWAWAVTQVNLPALEQALEALALFFESKCWFDQGSAMFQRTLAIFNPQESTSHYQILFARILAKREFLQYRADDESDRFHVRAETQKLLEQNLLRLQHWGVNNAAGDVYNCLGLVAYFTGDYHQAYPLIMSALTCYEQSDNHWGMARSLERLSLIALSLGDYAEAKRWCRQGIDLCEQRHCHMLLGEILDILGVVHHVLGEYVEGIRVVQAALAARTAVKNKRGIASSLQLLGELAWCMGDYGTAQARAQQSLAISQEIRLTGPYKAALNTLGNVACSLKEYPQAKTYFCTVLESPLRTGTLSRYWQVAKALLGLATVLMHEGKAAQATELLHHVNRHPTAWQETKGQASKLLSELPAEIVTVAQAQAAGRDLHEAVTEVFLSLEPAAQP